jgi:hypothetical protein
VIRCPAGTRAAQQRMTPPTSRPMSSSECKAGNHKMSLRLLLMLLLLPLLLLLMLLLSSSSLSLPLPSTRSGLCVLWTESFARSRVSIRACVLHRVFRFHQLLPISSSGRSCI